MRHRTPSIQGLERPVGSRRPVWRLALAGFCASFVGFGLARFAYTPLIPALIAAGWFAPANVVYLGAANLTGKPPHLTAFSGEQSAITVR